MDKYEAAIAELGLSFPEPTAPIANFVPYVITGSLVYTSGHVPVRDGQVCFIGKLGREFAVEQGQEAAQSCALQILALVRQACDGDLDRVVRCVRLTGLINSTPDFTDQPKVMNGASDLVVAVLGERGRHSRIAVSANSLPVGAAVEVEGIFEIA